MKHLYDILKPKQQASKIFSAWARSIWATPPDFPWCVCACVICP